MASLRRPSQAIQPGKQPHYVTTSSLRPPMPPDADTRRREARKSKVGDAIRRRMSMRYQDQGHLFSGAAPMPGQEGDFLNADPYGGMMASSTIREEDEDGDLDGRGTGRPSDASGSKFGQFASPEFAQGGFAPRDQASGSRSGARSGAAGDEGIRRRGALDAAKEEEWGFEELGKEGADVHGFIKRALTGADEDEKKRFRAALERYKQKNAKELQRTVFKNYAEFVTISKEISTLENDMLELKELLAQWKDLPQLMGMEDTLAPVIDKSGNVERRRTQRNSIADLQQMYRAQLTNLWATVEGSQKYLPIIPGRHLVYETHSYVELNAATYKAKQSISLFLLSDLLLIAGRRRQKAPMTAVPGALTDQPRERGRMVAERCWVLADLVVIDVKDSGDLTNALKIRRGKEVCVYRTSKSEDKKALLAAFRQVSQELGEKKRKENEREQQRRKSMWQGEIGERTLSQPASPDMRSPGRPLSTISTSMSDAKDLRWIDEFGDDLTMAIATRDWDESVKLVERGTDLLRTVAANPQAHELLSARLDTLRPNLVSALTFDLSSPEIRKAPAVRLITLLVQLGKADVARDTFLQARRDVMLRRVRDILAEGDISLYISELAVVCFTIIRHTSDWYMSAFKENRMASGFVSWAKNQIETFGDLFRRQVYAPTIDASVADECMKITAAHNKKLLRDIGLDFTFLLSSLLQPDQTTSSPVIHHSFQVDPHGADPAPEGFANYSLDGESPSPFSTGYTVGATAPDDPGEMDFAPPSGSTQPLSLGSKHKKAASKPTVGSGLTPAAGAATAASTLDIDAELAQFADLEEDDDQGHMTKSHSQRSVVAPAHEDGEEDSLR